MRRTSSSQAHPPSVVDANKVEATFEALQKNARVGPSTRGVARVHPVKGGAVLGRIAGVATMAEKYGTRIGAAFDAAGARTALAFFQVAVSVASGARTLATRFEDEAVRRVAPHAKAARALRDALGGIVKTDGGRDMADDYMKYCVTPVKRKSPTPRPKVATPG